MCFFDYAGIFNTVAFVSFLNLVLCVEKTRAIRSSLELLYKTKHETALHPLLYTQAGDEAVKCFPADRIARMKTKEEDVPEIRYDGTAPILFPPNSFTILNQGGDRYLCLSPFNDRWAKEHLLPSKLVPRIPEQVQQATEGVNITTDLEQGCIFFSNPDKGIYLVSF